MNGVVSRPWAGRGEVQSAQRSCECAQVVSRLNGPKRCNEIIDEVPEE